MEKSLMNLSQFILDFKLRQPNGIVCFNAKIDFYVDDTIVKTKDSEVHIITSDNLAIIYFLGSEISNSNLPDMFDIKNSVHTYVDKQYLKIESAPYNVLVFPKVTAL